MRQRARRTPSGSQSWEPLSDTWISALLLFALLVCVYTLTYSGAFRIDDEHILAARAQSLALWGELSNPQVYGNDRARELAGLAEPAAAQATGIEPAQTILAAGLYRLSLVLGVGGVQAMLTLNIYLVAATAALVTLAVRGLAFRPRTAIWCGLLFGLTTMAWPYSKTFYRDPLAMLLAALAFLGWIMASGARGRARAAGVALALTGALGGPLAKNTAMVLIPSFAIGWLWLRIRGPDRGRLMWRAWIGALAVGGLLVAIAAAVPAQGPLARYSLAYYLSLARHFARNLNLAALVSALGPLLSPAKSIFIFSPPLLLALWAGIRWRRRLPQLAIPALLTAALLAAAQALFYGQAWAGGFGWGLRYMLPALPPLMMLAAPGVEWLLEGERKLRRWALASLAGLGLLVQLGGAVVAWRSAYDHWLAAGLNPFHRAAAWDSTYLAIPIQIARLPALASWDLAWLRALPSSPAGALALAAGASGLALVSAWLLRRSIGGGLPSLLSTGSIGLAGLALILPLFPALRVLRHDPAARLDEPELQSALAWVEANLEPEDVVVVDSYGTSLWHVFMQRWSAPAAWYSLPFEVPGAAGVGTVPGGPPSQAAIALFQWVANQDGRLWYVESDQAPDSGLRRETAWLDGHFVLRDARRWVGQSIVQARLYELGQP